MNLNFELQGSSGNGRMDEKLLCSISYNEDPIPFSSRKQVRLASEILKYIIIDLRW